MKFECMNCGKVISDKVNEKKENHTKRGTFWTNSLSELETQLDIAIMLNFCDKNGEMTQRIFYIKNMLSKLILSINKTKPTV